MRNLQIMKCRSVLASVKSYLHICSSLFRFYMYPSSSYMSLVMRKPAFCMCENKDADQLRGSREADQSLCFRSIASKIPLLPKYKISRLYPSSVGAQPGLCRSWSETPKTGFLTTRLISEISSLAGHCR